MVVDLYQVKKKIKNRNQRQFVESLYELLDEFSPFLEQQSEAQLDYLYCIYKLYKQEIKRNENKA